MDPDAIGRRKGKPDLSVGVVARAYALDHAFEFGLRRVLDGIEVLIQSRSS